MATLASIDMGTNTFRLLVAELEGRSFFKEIRSVKRITRLGEGFLQGKRLKAPAIERAVAALAHFRDVLEEHKVDDLIVVGTSAIREAGNQREFLEEIRRRTGFDVEVISGEQEALCTFLGVNFIIQNQNDPMLVIDIGGGSTEFIGAEGDAPTFLMSAELGVVHLTEKYLRSDPPAPEELRQLRSAIAQVVRPIVYDFPPKCRFVGTAGTVTTLAAIDQGLTEYDPEKINRYALSHAAVDRISKEITSMTLERRSRIPGLEKGREDLLVSGALILLTVMDLFGYDPVYVSDYGLREGILLDRYQKKFGEASP
jgi:exopolyphosphatase / guanosine-5'-triphosphate,3'-diphosphate pyrophosphatase